MSLRKLNFRVSPASCRRTAVKKLIFFGLISGYIVFPCLSAANPGDPGQGVVTNLSELNQRLSADSSRVLSVRIEGTVWWSSATEGRVILKDDTAVTQLELDFPCKIPALGDLLVLEGDCTVTKTTDVIKLSAVPTVDHDGLHPPAEKSGTIDLKSGLHPIRVVWFDRADRFALGVYYESPELPRQKIPDDALFHLQVDPVYGTTNLVKGLEYQCFEGHWWHLLPNFDHLPSVTNGIVDNFDISVRTRDNHVGLRFSGFIDVPQDGQYTFVVLADDGSRLFIGDSSLKVETIARSDWASPDPMQRGEIFDEESEYQWSEIEGTVASYSHVLGGLEIDFMTADGVVKLKVAEDSDCSFTLRPQNRIRAEGVSRKLRKLDGQPMRGEFFVQRWDDVDQPYITPTIWTEHPLVEIDRLLAMDPSSVSGSIVHLQGMASTSGVDESMVLEDGSGRIVMQDIPLESPINGSVDVLGRVYVDHSDLFLHCIHSRSLGGSAFGTNSLPVLTTAEQICQLTFEEAARGYPVRIQGVVISNLEFDGAVVHDSSRGIYVATGALGTLQLGDYCEIEGVTGPFGFDPYIQATQSRTLGKGIFPTPIQPTWDQIINGTLHCNYVEIEGIVASVKGDEIALLTRDGQINVRLNPIGPTLPLDALGSTVRLRGSMLNDFDAESRRLVVGSIFLDHQKFTTILPAPEDPFDIPLKHVGDLLQFDPQAGALHRVKVSGQLVYQDEQMAYLMEDEHGLRFTAMKPVAATVGDLLEVVGFLDLSGPIPLLRNSVTRRIGPAELASPRKLDAHDLLRDEYDSTRVQVEGVLLGVSKRSDGTVLEVQSGHRRFMSILNEDTDLDDKILIPGSQMELTGVYAGIGGNRVLGLPIDSFKLFLNSDSDIRILSLPPWWNLRRLMLVVGALVGVLFGSLIWINLLHRKVETRTQQLGDQIRQRQLAERQRAMEQERSRLATNLHDDLGAGLTEVNMLAALLKSPVTTAEEKARYADEMNELALRMVTSLDEIVWAQNPRNDTVASLAGYFGAYAQRLLELASIRCGLDVADDLPECSLDPQFRQEIFMAFKEALTNVIRHADATKVWVRISIPGEELIVVVSDDGCGITSDMREIGDDGLNNMQSRLSALGGSCDIQSDPEKGTTVRLQATIQKVVP